MMLAIRNYTPHTIHGHKSHPNKKLFQKQKTTPKKKKRKEKTYPTYLFDHPRKRRQKLSHPQAEIFFGTSGMWPNFQSAQNHLGH
jgi:hypothetical protein